MKRVLFLLAITILLAVAAPVASAAGPDGSACSGWMAFFGLCAQTPQRTVEVVPTQGATNYNQLNQTVRVQSGQTVRLVASSDGWVNPTYTWSSECANLRTSGWEASGEFKPGVCYVSVRVTEGDDAVMTGIFLFAQ